MTKVKVFVYGQRRQQRRRRRGYDNSSPDFRHGELKSVENCGSMLIIVVQVSGLQNAFIRNQCIGKSLGPESNGAVRNPLFRGIVHWTKLKFTRLWSSFVKIYLAVAKRSEMFRLIRDQGSCKHLGFPIGPTNINMVEEVEILLL